jgi:hypothetical protein
MTNVMKLPRCRKSGSSGSGFLLLPVAGDVADVPGAGLVRLGASVGDQRSLLIEGVLGGKPAFSLDMLIKTFNHSPRRTRPGFGQADSPGRTRPKAMAASAIVGFGTEAVEAEKNQYHESRHYIAMKEPLIDDSGDSKQIYAQSEMSAYQRTENRQVFYAHPSFQHAVFILDLFSPSLDFFATLSCLSHPSTFVTSFWV